jgi:4-diphosphocytidyl-2-C-methyl-D-erythritol kinase
VKLRRVEADAFAKVNIGWRVGAKRDDGYHEVSGVMQTISLSDHLMFEVSSGEGVRVVVPSHPDLEGESNLVHAAARQVALHADPVPATVTIDKRIPIAAGLGGGSADAAAALLAFNVLWGAELSARKLVELGAEIGSDVPAILAGGLVHASGRGERVRRIGTTSGYAFVLGISDAHVSAADAYSVLGNPRHAERVFAYPERFERNDLEAAACELVPGLSGRLHAMREACGVAFVSGSGPTVVGVTEQPDEAVARIAGVFDRVEVASPTESGVVLRLQ